jgi:hypothetical protein
MLSIERQLGLMSTRTATCYDKLAVSFVTQ